MVRSLPIHLERVKNNESCLLVPTFFGQKAMIHFFHESCLQVFGCDSQGLKMMLWYGEVFQGLPVENRKEEAVEWKDCLEIGWGRTAGFHTVNQKMHCKCIF